MIHVADGVAALKYILQKLKCEESFVPRPEYGPNRFTGNINELRDMVYNCTFTFSPYQHILPEIAASAYIEPPQSPQAPQSPQSPQSPQAPPQPDIFNQPISTEPKQSDIFDSTVWDNFKPRPQPRLKLQRQSQPQLQLDIDQSRKDEFYTHVRHILQQRKKNIHSGIYKYASTILPHLKKEFEEMTNDEIMNTLEAHLKMTS